MDGQLSLISQPRGAVPGCARKRRLTALRDLQPSIPT
jgi:hypothetical protein